jgi:hypothetical protein
MATGWTRSRLPAVLGYLLAVLGFAALAGCDRADGPLTLDSPEATLDTAEALVRDGRADRLVDLIHADDDEMRSLLNQFGRFLGELQKLAAAVEVAFPEEVAQLRAEAEAAAAEGRAASLIDRLTGAPAGPGGNRGFGSNLIQNPELRLDTGSAARRGTPSPFAGGERGRSQREAFSRIAQQFFVDPYGWLGEGRDRLETVYVSDTMVALTWDGKTILPPFGLVLIEGDDGFWRLLLPTQYPGVRRAMPQNEDEYAVYGSIVRTLENVIVDLRRDVEAGKVRNLTDLSDSAVEKVAIPAALVMFALSEVMEERGEGP